jgi:ribosomal protein S18 acetylase RimI-like enzyme
MDVSSLGFRTDLILRRLAGASVEDRGDHIVVTTPANPGFWWGNFLLLAEPPRDIAPWVAAFQREFPEARHVAIGVDGTDGRAGDTTGLRPEVGVVLTATRFPPRAPDPYAKVRPLESDVDWAQAVELELVSHEPEPGPTHRLFVERRVAEARRLVEAGHGRWFGAFPDGTLRSALGIVTDGSGIARYQNVETEPEFRRRGLATNLVYEAGVHALAQMGAQTLVIVADPDDEAIRIYRAAGFEDRERQVQLMRAPQASE